MRRAGASADSSRWDARREAADAAASESPSRWGGERDALAQQGAPIPATGMPSVNRGAAVRGLSLHQIGTWVFGVAVLAVAAAVVLSFAMNTAADDLRQQANQQAGASLDHPRRAPGVWLSAAFAGDLGRANLAALEKRADDLDHRADRIREAAALAALVGLVVMLVTVRPEARSGEGRDASSPVANTRSKGSV